MTIDQQIGDENPAPAEVSAALEVVLASEMFRGSPQLVAFLRFIVGASLRGEAGRLKGYTIGVEALGREESFDPQIDPIVRVEATRLRRTLERYYAGPGANDTIVFALSRGSYVPAIRRRAGNAAATNPLTGLWRGLPDWRTPRAGWLAALAAVCLIGVAAVAIATRSPTVEKPRRATAAPGFDDALQPGNGMPNLLIPRVSLLGVPPAKGVARPQFSFAQPLTEKLRAAMARFDTLNVVADPAEDTGGPGAAPSRYETNAQYQLVGTGEMQEDGGAVVRFRLTDVAEGTVIWSRNFGPFAPSVDYGPAEDGVVRELAMTLAPPYGVIRANERKKQLAAGAGDPRYRCIVEASESFRTFDPGQHERARACLEALTARDPSFAMGFAYLAAVYSREYQYGLGPASVDVSILERALQAARQAVELSPESARAYQMQFTVLFAHRDIAPAFAAGDKAIALNPYDMTILSDYGGRLIMIGEVDRGLEALNRAAEDGAVRPTWYRFYLFLGSYLKNDMAAAASHASQIASDTYPLGLLARALSAAAAGNRDQARRAFDQLVTLRPQWRTAPREELGRLFPVASVADRLAAGLISAGLMSR